MLSLRSPTGDKFELDRLAEELDARDRERQSIDGGAPPDALSDLPLSTPLSHANAFLAAPTFDVEAFLLSRVADASLADLRSELRDYLAALKAELVQLINDDYAAFISLSTDLRGEGARLERLRYPLAELRGRILASRGDLQAVQDAIQEKLSKRANLRDEKTFLHLLLKVSESVTRLETLLLISGPSEDGLSATPVNGMSLDGPVGSKEDDALDDRSRSNRAKHLARVAAEYVQLLYHVSKAQKEQSAFVDEIQWRVDRIKATLSSDLDHLFASTVLAITEGKEDGMDFKATEPEKGKWMADLLDCLRTYDALGLWRDAEDVLRRELVRSFVKKTIFPGALNASHSPVLPHTPFATRMQPPPTASQPPRTPYTPFTAFASKQNPFEYTFGAAATASAAAAAIPYNAHLLDDIDDPLATLYNKVLRFVDRDLKLIMEAAEKVCVKSGSRARQLPADPAAPLVKVQQPRKDGVEAFEIMANVVWAEIGRAIMDDLAGVVFAAGRPDEFRKHHETTLAFVRALEFLAPSVHSIEAMRSHSVYTAFDRRWQLPVYFQLRWKEIVSKLEVALSVSGMETSVKTDQAPFVTLQAAATWSAITSCWSAEVYIPELSHRFWRFTLQLLGRYKTWIEGSLPTIESSFRVNTSLTAEKASSPAMGSGFATPGTDGGAESTAADNLIMRRFTAAIADIKTMETQITHMWQQEISVMLPREGFDGGEGETISPENALRDALASLKTIIPPISTQIVALLTKQCCDAVAPVKSILAQIRMNKRPPTEPSQFTISILRPVKVFFGVNASGGPGESLRGEFLKSYSEEVFEVACRRFIQYLATWRKAEESLRRLHRGQQRSTFSLFGSPRVSQDDQAREDERIRAQLVLDVEAFGRDAESLGVSLQTSEAYNNLHDMARTSLIADP